MIITDLQAKQTAGDWHGGQRSPLYALCSSGAIIDKQGLTEEICLCLKESNPVETIKLIRLLEYIHKYGDREPVDLWDTLHW